MLQQTCASLSEVTSFVKNIVQCFRTGDKGNPNLKQRAVVVHFYVHLLECFPGSLPRYFQIEQLDFQNGRSVYWSSSARYGNEQF